jgi:hypothetical protein
VGQCQRFQFTLFVEKDIPGLWHWTRPFASLIEI